MKCLKRLIISVATLTLFVSCGNSPEKARRELADLNVEYSEEAFVESVSAGDRVVTKLFLNIGMDPNLQYDAEISHDDLSETQRWEDVTPLVEAAIEGKVEIVRLLLEAGADPNVLNAEALFWASVIGNVEIVRILLDGGADYNIKYGGRTALKLTALEAAASRGQAEVVRSFLEAGADPNLKRRGGLTPIFYAVTDPRGLRYERSNTVSDVNRAETVHVLLEAGADPNTRGPAGTTPLILAAQSGNAKVVEALLAGGANPNLRTNSGATTGNGKTALALAVSEGNSEVARLLEEAGAENEVAEDQMTQQVKQAWTNLQEQYQRRSNLISNLINTLQGVISKQETLEQLKRAHGQASSIDVSTETMSDMERVQRYMRLQQQLSRALDRLLTAAENDSQLRANEAFRELKPQLEGTGNRINVARRDYEQVVNR